MHLADAFIQSDLLCIQAIHVFVSTCSLGIEPTTYALLMQCSTTEPHEHLCIPLVYTSFLFYIYMVQLYYPFPKIILHFKDIHQANHVKKTKMTELCILQNI